MEPLQSAHLPGGAQFFSTYMIRASALTGYIDLVNLLGGNADALLAKFGLDSVEISNPDAILPVEKVAGLLEEGARQTEQEDFALRLVTCQDLTTLGQLAIMALNCATVGEAIDKAIKYIDYYNSSIKIHLKREYEPGTAKLSLTPQNILTNPRYFIEFALGITHNCIRSLYGTDFHPLEIRMQCASPLPQQRYRRLFHAPVHLEHEENSLILSSIQLENPIDRSNPELQGQIAQRIIDVAGPPPQNFTHEIEQVIRRELACQNCTLKFVAQKLGMNLSEFKTHLAREAVDFDLLLDRIRLQRSDIYLSDDIPICEVASQLGFQTSDELNAACRRWFGMSSLQRRHHLRREN